MPAARAQNGEISPSPAPPQLIMPANMRPASLTVASPGAASGQLPFDEPGELKSGAVPGMPQVSLSLPDGFSVPGIEIAVAPLSIEEMILGQPAVQALAPGLVPVFGFQWGMVKPDGGVSIDPVSVSGAPTADVTLPAGIMPAGTPAVYYVADGALRLLPNVVVIVTPAAPGSPSGPLTVRLAGLTTTGEIETAVCASSCGSGGVLLGDVDGDGQVTVADARRLLRGLAGLVTLSHAGKVAGDADGDGQLTVHDVILILRIATGAAG